MDKIDGYQCGDDFSHKLGAEFLEDCGETRLERFVKFPSVP